MGKASKFYTLHEYGAPSHFYGLEYLVKDFDGELLHREFNLFRQLGSSIKRINVKTFCRFTTNTFFLLSLLFTKNKKIVVGIAPYNKVLKTLTFFFKRHQIYYFTSYTCWDQSRMVHSKHFSNKLLSLWKEFTQHKVEHIFAVSKLTKEELVKNNFAKEEKITVVNHSYNIDIIPSSINRNAKFITVGHLSYKKGINQLLEIFKKLPHFELTIVGDGELKAEVEKVSKEYHNVHYKGYIKGLENLIPVYKKHSFLILNSHRTSTWEELFGLVLIEGMACGLIPIATKHPGPTEVITDGVNGILCDEGNILSGINKAVNLEEDIFREMKNQATKRAKGFHFSEISKKWKKILE